MKPRPLFPLAVTLQATALIFEGDGRPAFYICAQTRSLSLKLYRVPEGCAVTVHAPHPLPPTADGQPRVFLPAGSHAVFETAQGSRTALSVHSVRMCRELLEAVEAHAHSLKAWQDARATFEGKAGAA